MRIATTPAFERTARPILVTRSVTLLPGDVYRLPRQHPDVWVVSGRAWATSNGEDIVLNSGDHMSFHQSRDVVVITSVGRTPLVLEIPEK